jgi:hypothetical protein
MKIDTHMKGVDTVSYSMRIRNGIIVLPVPSHLKHYLCCGRVKAASSTASYVVVPGFGSWPADHLTSLRVSSLSPDKCRDITLKFAVLLSSKSLPVCHTYFVYI